MYDDYIQILIMSDTLRYILLIIIAILIIYSLIQYFGPNSEKYTNEKFTNQNGEIKLYYANWCKYSKMFLPEWDKFEQQAPQQLPNITVSKIACENGQDAMCAENGVRGYPTVILYIGNKQIKFDKQRNCDELIKFVKDNMY